MRISGVVVLYYPQNNFTENIISYIAQLERLYVIDNTEIFNSEIETSLNQLRQKYSTQITYISNGTNKGIAVALNIACLNSLESGFDFILTMDQDSFFANDSFPVLLKALSDFPNEELGILSPYHYTLKALQHTNEYTQSKSVMTSGNLLSLKAFKKTGLFNEGFFIDYVDHEYCLRLRQNGYKIITANYSLLKHELGNSGKALFIGMKISVSNHSPLRRYYITRNRWNTIVRFFLIDPLYCIDEIGKFTIDTVKIVVGEKEVWRKLKYTIKGLIDFLRVKQGKYGA